MKARQISPLLLVLGAAPCAAYSTAQPRVPRAAAASSSLDDSSLCAITIFTGSAQDADCTCQTLVGEVLTSRSSRRRDTVAVLPRAMRTCHGARARALLSLDPSMGWHHGSAASGTSVEVFEQGAPTLRVPAALARSASASEVAAVGLLRHAHNVQGEGRQMSSDAHFRRLEGFYSL